MQYARVSGYQVGKLYGISIPVGQ